MFSGGIKRGQRAVMGENIFFIIATTSPTFSKGRVTA